MPAFNAYDAVSAYDADTTLLIVTDDVLASPLVNVITASATDADIKKLPVFAARPAGP